MNDSRSPVSGAATTLLDAEAERRAIAPLSDDVSDLDVDLAYAIQDEALRQRRSRGERVVGVKLGLTSRAKQAQMGTDVPLTAWLTDAMLLPAGEPVPYEVLIHPRAEPEIVFVMGERLAGPGVSAATALAAVRWVCAGIEVIDSRYRDFRFSLSDVVADNASSARFQLGPVLVEPGGLDLSLEACVLEQDGIVTETATGAAVQGHPAEALALAANALAHRGHAIEPGWIVLTGGMTNAVALSPASSLSASFTTLGTVSMARGS